jgi:nitroreductase
VLAAREEVTTPDLGALEAAERLIRSRRTNLRIDPEKPVDQDIVDRLCDLGVWAPNHKRTHPWRFASLVGAARARLGEVTADWMEARGEAEPKVAKTRTKYLRSAVVLCVAAHSAPDASPERRGEDRDAVAAGVQNILLGATAAGLNSYWGTGAVVHAPAVKELCGFDPDAVLVAVVYLGWPLGDVPVPARAPAGVHHVEP